MIQRIQSIYLLIAGLGFFGQFATDIATSAASIPGYFVDKIYQIQDSPILLGMTIAGGVMALVTIFLYNNRGLQKKLSIFSLILAIMLPVTAILLILTEKTGPTDVEINESGGTYLPIVSIIFAYLAYRNINKDDKLVKSMDRLR